MDLQKRLVSRVDSMIREGKTNSEIRKILGPIKKHMLASRRIIHRRQNQNYFPRRIKHGDQTQDPPAKVTLRLTPRPKKCPKCTGNITMDIVWSADGTVKGWRCLACGLTAESQGYYDANTDERREYA